MSSTDTAKVAQTPAEPRETTQGPKCLYDTLLERFRTAMNSEQDDAFKRYGLALFHSLAPEEQFLAKEELGIKCKDAVDFYNLGLAYASKEDYEKAISCWTQALKGDPEMADVHYNIAVANERLKNLSAARTHYKRYLGSIDDAEETERINQHLAELGS